MENGGAGKDLLAIYRIHCEIVMETSNAKIKIGLGLSGGGYRAAAFHLGTLRKLNALGILDKISVLSTVSGGSIVGVDYLLSLTANDKTYKTFEDTFIKKLRKSVIAQVLRSATFISLVVAALLWFAAILYFQFSNYVWMSWILLALGSTIGIIRQFKIFPVSSIIMGIYDRIFFSKKTLKDLPDSPLVAINATNIETGRPFIFSKDRMGDSTYDFMKPPIQFHCAEFRLSRSVMASSCVPSVFTPVSIPKRYFENLTEKRVNPQLLDGGIYDNQGIHKLTVERSRYSCDIVIVSDAGNKMSSKSVYGNVFSLLVRVMDLFMVRIKKFQIQDNIYKATRDKNIEIAYISLGWDLGNCIPGFIDNLENQNIPRPIIEALKIPADYLNPVNRKKVQEFLEEKVKYKAIISQAQPKDKLELARNVSTNLTALSTSEIDALINQAELMTELQIKLYCPSLFIEK
jgi:NTE family protein